MPCQAPFPGTFLVEVRKPGRCRVFSLVGVHDEVGFEMAMTDGADHVELRPEARFELSRRGQFPGASEFGLVHAIDGDAAGRDGDVTAVIGLAVGEDEGLESNVAGRGGVDGAGVA